MLPCAESGRVRFPGVLRLGGSEGTHSRDLSHREQVYPLHGLSEDSNSSCHLCFILSLKGYLLKRFPWYRV